MENTFIPVAVINNPKIRDYYICGDLHGMYSILMNALGKTGFDPTQDKLICTGDIVDYGWQNEKCIELLDKDWFLSVRGEHEQTIINALKSETFQYEHLMNGGDWLYELPLTKHIEIAQRFSKLPYAIEIHHQGKIYGVVHADVLGNSWNVFKNSLTKKGFAEYCPETYITMPFGAMTGSISHLYRLSQSSALIWCSLGITSL